MGEGEGSIKGKLDRDQWQAESFPEYTVILAANPVSRGIEEARNRPQSVQLANLLHQS